MRWRGPPEAAAPQGQGQSEPGPGLGIPTREGAAHSPLGTCLPPSSPPPRWGRAFGTGHRPPATGPAHLRAAARLLGPRAEPLTAFLCQGHCGGRSHTLEQRHGATSTEASFNMGPRDWAWGRGPPPSLGASAPRCSQARIHRGCPATEPPRARGTQAGSCGSGAGRAGRPPQAQGTGRAPWAQGCLRGGRAQGGPRGRRVPSASGGPFPAGVRFTDACVPGFLLLTHTEPEARRAGARARLGRGQRAYGEQGRWGRRRMRSCMGRGGSVDSTGAACAVEAGLGPGFDVSVESRNEQDGSARAARLGVAGRPAVVPTRGPVPWPGGSPARCRSPGSRPRLWRAQTTVDRAPGSLGAQEAATSSACRGLALAGAFSGVFSGRGSVGTSGSSSCS